MTDAAPFVCHASPFSTLDAVRSRVTEAVLGQSGINHPSLIAEIRRRFGSIETEAGALVQEPVIEAALPYLAGDESLGSLAGKRLHPKVVEALAGGGHNRQYIFPRELKPYQHQLDAWELLTDSVPRSVLVTSGTGSGKTECFLIPLLHDLACEAEAVGRLTGVRAIALYPLNALIASQEERLREWTAPFNGRIRFGLYNGNMPEDAQGSSQSPEQVSDRRTLRLEPPPILVTNVTMLEYMTVRRQDRSLIEASRGKLRWIILDEAHSYVGSAAAEIALLIRRALLAFGVTPADVRFVATSATIGEGEAVAAQLKRFLGDVAGLPEAHVHVVVGRRRALTLPTPVSATTLNAAALGDSAALARNPVVQDLARRLSAGPMSWTDFRRLTAPTQVEPEALARGLTAPGTNGEPLLPLRVHGFLRAVPGLWACLNSACSGKPAGDWPFGAVLSERVEACPHCTGAVLELVSCAECGEPFLEGMERDGTLRQARRPNATDEFAADSEAESDGETEEPDSEPTTPRPDIARLIALQAFSGARPLHIEPTSGRVCDGVTDSSRTVRTHDRDRPEQCPACRATGKNEDSPGTLLRPFRFGAPFLIGNAAPVLLDGVAPRSRNPDLPVPPPSEGRQLLSFTDSRQGTARFAAALQSASERNHVRAMIYHAVQDTLRPQPEANDKAVELDSRIAALEPVAGIDAKLGDMLADLRKERAKLFNPAGDGLSWPTMRDQLAARPEIDHWMRRVWNSRDVRFQRSASDFAQFLLLRELARRPRRANALETLGLARLRFPTLDALGEQRLPRAFRERGRTLVEWRDFLTLLLTVRVRNAFAIRMDRADVHWLIKNGFPRVLLSPDGHKSYASELTWLKAGPKGRQSIAVKLLERALGLSAENSEQRAEINETLRGAWECLFPLFTQPGVGAHYALDLDKAYVAPVRMAYFCPVSRRLLDTTFARISPYGLDGSSRHGGQVCETVEMPCHPNPFLLAERGGAGVVEEWLEADALVSALRARGLWGNLHDRIALGSPYTRAAEHSAQQPPVRLRRYESEFKAGQINILNCSTTMEMGVDIGSVSSVVMTNVPPSIANYRQRIGRAGRRGQGFAASLTYARDTPLDREAFSDPTAYLARKIEAPKVTLDSRRIVQRHVNALLLATWFKQAGGEVLKTTAGDFFGCPPVVGATRPESAPARSFHDWVTRPSTLAETAEGIRILIRGSALAGDQSLHAAAGDAMAAAESGFISEWDAIQAQAKGLEREAARKSLGFQLKRMCGEYLLGELADRGVLPGHGFPTAVVPFVNKDEPDEDEAANRSEGNRYRRRNYPTRNLDVAIRDYAPGAEVVVDGLVFRSAGVTLNWKRPAGESSVGEIQSLKWFWDCQHCGAADTARLQPVRCVACEADEESLETRRFLEPAGFTVDMAAQPHAEIEQVTYVEPEPERVAARGAAWRPFLDPDRGRLRASREGLVFYSSAGGTGSRGYAVCLECGRAEAEHTSDDPGKKPLHEHRPLRFTKADADGICPGNAGGFRIQTNLALGHEITTDVAEVQPTALSDPRAAWALASALREALARRRRCRGGEPVPPAVWRPRPTRHGGRSVLSAAPPRHRS
ncbi:ATP-dependent RNA helicase RhlE [Methylobacterium soli]|uniref:DEAD/DEAH box helicase n=1 Tax=Methylobacterium soli TaxID=553447 RepID=UPI001EE36DB8|nr:DEAD/DEAH box helicase [Methylobacterium soli]GJE42190.1 ATP-dependent RNA helicase RhlE [Methylobacterium soli]